MKHADRLVQRILHLEGSAQSAGSRQAAYRRKRRGNFARRPRARKSPHPLYKEAVGYCESCGDYVTRDLLAAILSSEEEHIGWLETQLGLIDRLGLPAYLQAQVVGNPSRWQAPARGRAVSCRPRFRATISVVLPHQNASAVLPERASRAREPERKTQRESPC
jgi:hypothetical protein